MRDQMKLYYLRGQTDWRRLEIATADARFAERRTSSNGGFKIGDTHPRGERLISTSADLRRRRVLEALMMLMVRVLKR